MYTVLIGVGAVMENILSLPNVWRASEPMNQTALLATGFTQLDEQFGGWPSSGVVELAASEYAALSLWWPLLARLSQAQQVALINPPAEPFAHGLLHKGLNLAHVLCVQAGELALWSAEQCLLHRAMNLVLVWQHKSDSQAIRRLQIQADKAQALLVLISPRLTNNSSARMKLQCKRIAQGLLLNVLKRQGGWPLHDLVLPLTPRVH